MGGRAAAVCSAGAHQELLVLHSLQPKKPRCRGAFSLVASEGFEPQMHLRTGHPGTRNSVIYWDFD